MKDYTLLKKNNNIVLLAHKLEPQFLAEINTNTNEVHSLQVCSNGYLTKELNILLEQAKYIATKINTTYKDLIV